MRKPSTPLSNQKANTSSNSARTSAILPVEVGLTGREQVQVPLAVARPWSRRARRRRSASRWAAVRRPHLGRAGSGSAAVPSDRRPAPRRTSAWWSELWFGTMSSSTRMPASCASGDHPICLVQGSVDRFDVAIVGHVVAGVRHRRRVPRVDPDGIDAEARQVRQSSAQTGDVADAVAVPIGETADVDLVDDGGLPPGFDGCHGSPRIGFGDHHCRLPRCVRSQYPATRRRAGVTVSQRVSAEGHLRT